MTSKEMFNADLFREFFAIKKDTPQALAAALRVSERTLKGRMERRTAWKLEEIRAIAERWKLHPGTVNVLFFNDGRPVAYIVPAL